MPIDHISDHGISLGIYFRDPDGNGVEVFYELPRAEWPADYHVFSKEHVGRGRFPGPVGRRADRAGACAAAGRGGVDPLAPHPIPLPARGERVQEKHAYLQNRRDGR